PTVLVLDSESRSTLPLDVLRAFVDAGGAIVALGRDGEPALPAEMPGELFSGYGRHPAGVRQLLVAVRAGYREAAARAETARARAEAASRGREIAELTHIGVALGTERDLDTLLDLILTQSRRITSSDAGSLYLIEGEPGEKRLRFRLAQTYSKPEAPFVEFTMPMDRSSLAGYAAVTGEPLVIDDAYFLPPDVEYTINRSFDERYGYRTKSMLVIPMKDHKEQVIGVLQLINRKRHFEAALATPDDLDEQVREIRYAGLLHDFGKVGVREQVLVKAKKLYPLQLELIRQRHDFVRRSAEWEFWRKRAEFLETHGRKGYEQFLQTLQQEHAAELAELERFMATVLQANEPTVIPDTHFDRLLVMAR